MRQLLLPAVLAVCASLAHAQDAWPERVVTIEDLKAEKPMRILVPKSRPDGDVKRPVTLRVHVGAEGDVKRVVLIESCGSPGHDSAAIKSMKQARFKPYLVDGTPTDVTLVVPLHLPVKKA